MEQPRLCRNCHAELPTDQPPEDRYCADCAAAWGANQPTASAPTVGESPRVCANCGSPLPITHPTGHTYCDKCAAAWQRGGAATGN